MPLLTYQVPSQIGVHMAARKLSSKVALVVGAGEATGSAVAKRFAKEGYYICAVRRNGSALEPLISEIESNGGRARGFGVDARQEDQVVDLVERIESEIGSIDVAVHNIGANVRFSVLDTTSRVYRKVWEMACFSAFLTGREVAKRMVPRERGTILFTGATASIRGGKGFAAFSGAKFATRSLAQSMARELGPKGIHVAHTVVDGAIDTQWIRENFKDEVEAAPADGLLPPSAVADAYWALHQQPRGAWTHEMDLRPWCEKW